MLVHGRDQDSSHKEWSDLHRIVLTRNGLIYKKNYAYLHQLFKCLCVEEKTVYQPR